MMRFIRILALALLGAAPHLSRADAGTNASPAEARLAAVVIPRLTFERADPLDVVDLLVSAVRGEWASVGSGASLSLAPRPARGGEPDPRQALVRGTPLVTADLRNITLLDAVRQLTHRAGLRYEITDRELVITTASGAVLNRARVQAGPAPAPR